MLNPGLHRNPSESPDVIVFDSFHLEMTGSSASQLAFSQPCPSIRAHLSPRNHFNPAHSGTFPESFALWIASSCYLNLGFSILSFPQIPVAIFSEAFSHCPYFHTKPSKVRNLRHIVIKISSGVPDYLKAGLRYCKN